MSERSLRLKRDTPLENVIAAFNGLAERVDALEAKGEPVSRCGQCDGACAHGSECHVLKASKPLSDPVNEAKASGMRTLLGLDTLTQADVRQAVEYAVRETRSGIPDATASWTLHLGPGCTVENTESGNRFTVEPGNAIVLDAEVKLRVLDKAEALIDPRAKAKPTKWSMNFIEAPVTASGDTDWHAVEQLAKLKILEAKTGR